MGVPREHYSNVVSLEATPSVRLGRDAAESEDLLVPIPRARHVVCLEHRNQIGHSHNRLQGRSAQACEPGMLRWLLWGQIQPHRSHDKHDRNPSIADQERCDGPWLSHPSGEQLRGRGGLQAVISCSGANGAARPTKMGTIASPSRYDVLR
jgi:hypothetical protein